MGLRTPVPFAWPSNPLSRAASKRAISLSDEEDGGWAWSRSFDGNAVGWAVATQIWDAMWTEPVHSVRGRATPAACFSLFARANLRAGTDEYEPQHLWWLADLETGLQFCEHLMVGENEQVMIGMFGAQGVFHLYGPRQKAEMMMPWLRWLPQPAGRWRPPKR